MEVRGRSRRRATVADALSLVVAALPSRKVFAFGLGHVVNDLTASIWFSYLLVMLNKVLGFASWQGAVILLTGQMSDAAVTPFVGMLSDKAKNLTVRFPGCSPLTIDRRHVWYCIGVLLQLLMFFFLFARCVMCDITGSGLSTEDGDSAANVGYYVVTAAIYNVGWACVQVSHMSLLPELTSDTLTRVKLNSARYIANVFSNLFVYVLLGILVDAAGLSLVAQFNTLAYVCIGVGACTSVLFVLGTKDTPAEAAHRLQEEEEFAATMAVTASDDTAAAPAAAAAADPSPPPPKKQKQRTGVDAADAAPIADRPAIEMGGVDVDVVAAPAEDESSAAVPASPSRSSSMDLPPPGTDVSPAVQPLPAAVMTPEWETVVLPSSAITRVPVSPFARRAGAEGAGTSSSSSSFSVSHPSDALESQLSVLPVVFTSYRTWFHQPEFWCLAFVYGCARLVINCTSVFLPLYILDVLELPTVYITILPCILYIASLAAAAAVQFASRRGVRLPLIFYSGSALGLVGLAILLGLTSSSPGRFVVFLAVLLIGAGNGCVIVCATQFTTELIGSRTNYAAFVVGSFSFVDKTANGIMLFMLQLYNNSAEHERMAVAIPSMVALALACLVLVCLVDLADIKRKHTVPAHLVTHTKRKHNSGQQV